MGIPRSRWHKRSFARSRACSPTWSSAWSPLRRLLTARPERSDGGPLIFDGCRVSIVTGMSNDADAERVTELARGVVADHDPKTVPTQEYLGACYDAGLSWVHFPEGLGGLGVSRGLQAVADRILQGAGGPAPLGLNPMGYGMAAPTIREHAQTEDVKRHWLRPLATTEDIWCQL